MRSFHAKGKDCVVSTQSFVAFSKAIPFLLPQKRATGIAHGLFARLFCSHMQIFARSSHRLCCLSTVYKIILSCSILIVLSLGRYFKCSSYPHPFRVASACSTKRLLLWSGVGDIDLPINHHSLRHTVVRFPKILCKQREYKVEGRTFQ